MRTLFLVLLTSLLVTAASALAQFDHCGDFDNNGMTTVADMVLTIQYLYDGGAAPDDFDRADFDKHQKLTYRDMIYLWQCVFICDFWNVQCPPTEAPYDPPVDPNFKLFHPSSVPAQHTKFAIELRTSTTTTGAIGFSYPLKLRIDGAIPVIDSVVFPIGSPSPPYNIASKFVDAANGIVTFVGMRNSAGPAYEKFARIYVTVPNLMVEKPLTLEWIALTPAQAPVGQEDAVFAIAARPNLVGEIEPVLTPKCCNVPGDADNNGIVTVSDAITGICFIFGGDCGKAISCTEEADSNGDGAFSISDCVYTINYVFNGGPAPAACR